MKEFVEENVRAEAIFHFGTQLIDDYAMPSALSDAFDDDLDLIFEAIGIPAPDGDLYEIVYCLNYNEKFGYLVQFATPIPQNVQEDSSYAFSWGYYATEWIYAETYEEACAKALIWKREYLNKALQREEE